MLDPFSRRRIERQAAAARDLLAPQLLIRLLGPCARLFPYHIVAGSGVLEAFRREAPLLARWLAARELARPGDEVLFAGAWRRALPDLRRHARLQRTLERATHDDPIVGGAGDIVTGRFRIQRGDETGLWVSAGAEERGPLRGPAATLGLFRTGQEASLAFQGALVGWTLLAASLPCWPGELDEWLNAESLARGEGGRHDASAGRRREGSEDSGRDKPPEDGDDQGQRHR